MSRLLVIEPHGSGHRAIYVQRLIEGALAAGRSVVLGTTPAFKVKYLDGQPLGDLLGSCEVIVLPCAACDAERCGPLGLLANERANWQYARSLYHQASAQVPVDEVFVPYLDYFLHVLGVLGSPFGQTTYSGIAMRVGFHFKRMGVQAPVQRASFLRQALFDKVLADRRLAKLYTIDPSLKEDANVRLPRQLAEKLIYLPDPVDPPVLGDLTVLDRSRLALPTYKKMLLVYGSIEPRKGLAWLLHGINRSPMDNWVVVLAGQQTPAGAHMISELGGAALGAQGRLLMLNRRIDEDEEAALFTACDAVWANYTGFFQMSGVFVKAAAYGKPVLLNRDGVLGYMAGRYAGSVVLRTGADWTAALSGIDASETVPAEATQSSSQYPYDHFWPQAQLLIFGQRASRVVGLTNERTPRSTKG